MVGLFLNLVAYSIITEDNAGQHHPDYAYNHALFTNDMRIYSDSKVSDFLHKVTIDQRPYWGLTLTYSMPANISVDNG